MRGNYAEVHVGLYFDEQASQLAWQSENPVIVQADYCRLTPAAGKLSHDHVDRIRVVEKMQPKKEIKKQKSKAKIEHRKAKIKN